jgi:hypothetical protein
MRGQIYSFYQYKQDFSGYFHDFGKKKEKDAYRRLRQNSGVSVTPSSTDRSPRLHCHYQCASHRSRGKRKSTHMISSREWRCIEHAQ